MTDPLLLFLCLDGAALLVVGAALRFMPRGTAGFVIAGLAGLGAMLCLPPLLTAMPPTGLALPFGPLGLQMHLALDSLSAFFLLFALAAGAAVAAFQSVTEPGTAPASVRATATCLAGTVLALLAADATSLAAGAALVSAPLAAGRRGRVACLVLPLLLFSVCLLAPAGFPPSFDAIRMAPTDPGRAMAAAVLAVAAVALLCSGRAGTGDAIRGGVMVPVATYLVLRVVAGLCGPGLPGGWTAALMLAGAASAVWQARTAAEDPDIQLCVTALMRRQAGLAVASAGLALLARAADLPAAAAMALAAAMLLTAAGCTAGTAATLAAHAISAGTGTGRLSRLGGLAQAMPATSAALAVGLLGLSAVPPGAGFASLWLAFQSVLSAPRTGGLIAQLPLALTAGMLALSAAVTTAGSVRLTGIAVLGRPRTPQGAGACEPPPPSRTILLGLACASLVPGALPGATVALFAGPAIKQMTGVTPHVPAYPALPLAALLALAALGTVPLRRGRRETKAAGPWNDGMEPPFGLPFGEPAAQAGPGGFLPRLPPLGLPARALPAPPALPMPGEPTARAGFWVILGLFGGLLLLLAVAQ